ncbi:MAG: DUF192 domain-containing protein [Zoogloeaceae bacterium]|nr:DUF192 domain-containing protein [Zoogloeaceae bacterium]
MSFLPHLPRTGLELEGRRLPVDVALASTFLARLRGLMLSDPIAPACGLLIVPCNSIHTLGIRGALEAVFLSKKMQVLKISSPLKPWRSLSACSGAWAVLEWRVGEAANFGLREGSQLKQVSAGGPPLKSLFP